MEFSFSVHLSENPLVKSSVSLLLCNFLRTNRSLTLNFITSHHPHQIQSGSAQQAMTCFFSVFLPENPPSSLVSYPGHFLSTNRSLTFPAIPSNTYDLVNCKIFTSSHSAFHHPSEKNFKNTESKRNFLSVSEFSKNLTLSYCICHISQSMCLGYVTFTQKKIP